MIRCIPEPYRTPQARAARNTSAIAGASSRSGRAWAADRASRHGVAALVLLCVAVTSGNPAGASETADHAGMPPINTDAVWDGATTLRVPVRLGSDTRLVMPEPFDDVWEHDDDVACTLLDDRTLIIRPRKAGIEQRLTMRGRRTGTLYLARVSSALPYTPIVTVHDLAPHPSGAPADPGERAVLDALKAMMRATPPPGSEIQPSRRILLDQAPVRIAARELWRLPRGITGIIVRIQASVPPGSIPVVPADIDIRIPRLGTLRAMGADDFRLDAAHPSTQGYLVYADR
ncbi:uncharacterized protein E1O_04320 [Burkholderiales bacterium GJ-E10]|nr:uncharacterized protein E1O_04320 [Burkholderiales bacterium GJ-E10]